MTPLVALAEPLDRLIEALDAETYRRRQAPYRRKLTRELRRAFRRQQREVLAAFAEQRSVLFREAVGDVPLDWLLGALTLSSRWITGAIQRALPAAVLAGARSVLGRLRDAFDLRNPRAVAFMREALNRSSRITDETFRQLRDVITKGIDEGLSYTQMAKAIREKFRQFATPTPQRHIRDRAELIAVTEIGDAYSAGTLMAAQRLADRGIRMEKSWLTVGDDRVEEECAGNQEQGWIALELPFSSGDSRPLAHPACRCALLTRIASDTRKP